MPSISEPEVGATGSAQLVVQASDLASSWSADGLDSFPPVFATARMIGLMEVAAARILQPLLRPGELSVGVHVDVTHTAATPAGARVIATARYTGREGKLFVFEVAAADPGGGIGSGLHTRAIVGSNRLVSGAARRNTPG